MTDKPAVDATADEDWTDELAGGTYVTLPAIVGFDNPTPERGMNQWGRPYWQWDVVRHNPDGTTQPGMKLRTTSRRLARALAGYAKAGTLKDATLTIAPQGEKLDRTYTVGVAK